MASRSAISQAAHTLLHAFLDRWGRMDKSLSPRDTINRLRSHCFGWLDSIYILHFAHAAFWLTMMPSLILKILIPILFSIALLIPFTSQFFFPAIPIFSWILVFFASRYIPFSWRPAISVVLLPSLESVLYGANISDILTRFTHPVLDIVAWIPYGLGHFSLPFIVAAFLWLFCPKEALHFWARAYGYMNLIGVLVQIVFPCAAPWYEVIYGLTPANYSMKGSPGGLIRIDRLFHSHGYTTTFSNAPVVFGAFPSLHAGGATMEALFVSHFFPFTTRYVWAYAGTLYWATMYLTHHYLIDVTTGACLAIACFYLFLPDEFRAPSGGPTSHSTTGGRQRSKYEVYDLEAPRGGPAEFDLSEASSEDEEMDITYRAPTGKTPPSSASLPRRGGMAGGVGKVAKSHRHTASIASLIRGDERSPEEGWSPLGATFSFPARDSNRERDEELRRS